jgi:putative hydrolase of HD superfamily
MTKTLPWVASLLLAAAAVPCCALPTCGNSTEPAAVVQAQVEAYNEHNVEAFVSCYATNVSIYWLDGKTPTVKGLDALRAKFAFLGRIPAAGAGYGVDILTKTITGPTIANVEHLRGLPPGAPPQPDTLVIYEVRDGKILNVWFAPAK